MADLVGVDFESWSTEGALRVVRALSASSGEPVRVLAVSTPTPTLVDGIPQ